MKRKGKESKLNVALTSLLVVFVCLLSFSIGVISGKGWSDREYQVRYIHKDDHVKAANEDTEPLGDEMTQKEVELLTKRALEEAEATQPEVKVDTPEETSALDKMESEVKASNDKKDEGKRSVASEEEEEEDDDGEEGDDEEPKGREASTAKAERNVSSLIPQPSTPKPTAIDYTVQVAAYKTLEDAERHSQKLIDKGFPAFPVKAMIGGKLWYRVSIGSFKTRKQAMKYESELKRQSVVKNTFVQKIERLQK